MGLKGLVIASAIFMVSCIGYSAGEHTVIGGRAAALGATSVTQSDEWSVFNNQAGLAWCKRFSAGIYVENRYLVKDLSKKAIVLTIPAGRGSFGIFLSQFGFALYSELNTGVSYGMRLTKKFSAGVRVDYLNLHIADGFRDNHVLSCEIGLQFRASGQLWLGLHVANPVPVRLSSLSAERLPTLMRFGLSWRITEDLHGDAEVEKDLVHQPALKAGIEYRPAKTVFIRIGLLSDPGTFTFGFGLEFGNLKIDLASSYHMVLGYSPQASISYLFGKKIKKKTS